MTMNPKRAQTKAEQISRTMRSHADLVFFVLGTIWGVVIMYLGR